MLVILMPLMNTYVILKDELSLFIKFHEWKMNCCSPQRSSLTEDTKTSSIEITYHKIDFKFG